MYNTKVGGISCVICYYAHMVGSSNDWECECEANKTGLTNQKV